MSFAKDCLRTITTNLGGVVYVIQPPDNSENAHIIRVGDTGGGRGAMAPPPPPPPLFCVAKRKKGDKGKKQRV